MNKIYLASASPRRVELLKLLGIPFEQRISNVEEQNLGGVEPDRLAEEFALAKARAVAEEVAFGVVIGADTIVVLQGQILGKPREPEEAVNMLRLLNGTEHLVISGVAIIDAATGKELVDHETTKVTFRSLTDREICSYVSTKEPMDKAGAYGIQGIGGILVKGISGCYNNVVGLPLTMLTDMLKDIGLDVWEHIGKGDDCETS